MPQVTLITLLLAGALLVALPAGMTERMSELRDPSSDPTIGRRWGYHLIGLDLLASHPLLGVGPNNFRWHYLSYEYRFMPGRYLEARDLHDMYLSVAVESGVVGLAIFLWLIGAVLAALARARRTGRDPEIRALAEGIQFALILLLTASLFGAVQTNKVLWALFAMGAAAGRLAVDEEAARASGPERGPLPDAA